MNVILCNEKTPSMHTWVEAKIFSDVIMIEGRDEGDEVESKTGEREFEFTIEFKPRETLKLLRCLKPKAQLSELPDLLVENFSGIGGIGKLNRFCKDHNIPFNYKSRHWQDSYRS